MNGEHMNPSTPPISKIIPKVEVADVSIAPPNIIMTTATINVNLNRFDLLIMFKFAVQSGFEPLTPTFHECST